MTPPTAAQQQAWLAQWRSASIELPRAVQAQLLAVDLWRVAADLEDACVASASAERRVAGLSGLVEQQRLLHRRRNA